MFRTDFWASPGLSAQEGLSVSKYTIFVLKTVFEKKRKNRDFHQ
jgi:hypothetical protein